jgi:prephenate dehydrogenase
MSLNRMSIIGVGLLGGSIGLAVRSVLSDCKITGYGHRQETLNRAAQIGAIDQGTQQLADAAADADLVILCTPVGRFDEILRGLSKFLRPGAVVTDVGSTKASVVELADKILPQGVHFVGSHPMAGSEKRGVEFARADLFQNALCILTPTERTDATALATVESFWKTLGMRTCRMTPADHDRALAEVSHLPHALAAALVAMQSPEALALSGKGFLDTTRIAGGDGGLWRDIFIDNAPNMRAAIGKFRAMLEQFEQMLEPGKGEELRRWLDDAAGKREALLAEKLREVTPD